MKITIDSSESLDDAIRVLGAVYGVKLVLDTTDEKRIPSAVAGLPTAAEPAAPGRPAGPTKTTRKRRKSHKTAAAARSRRTSRQVVPAPSSADIRRWARQQRLAVSDRGRLPVSVLAAYRDAHAG